MTRFSFVAGCIIGLVSLTLAAAVGAEELPVRGRVVDEAGEGVADATVAAISVTRPARTLEVILAQGTTDDEGAFSFTLPEDPGDQTHFYFIARHPSYGVAYTWSPTLEWSGSYDDIKLTLPEGGAIQGSVVDSDGNPVAGAVVAPSYRYQAPDGNQWHLPVCRPLIGAETAADGSFRVDCLPKTAKVMLRVTHPKFGMALAGVPETVADNQTGFLEPDGEPVAVTMLPCGAIAGSVTLPDGAPAAGVEVAATLVSTEDDRSGSTKGNLLGPVKSETSDDGQYRLKGLPPGNYGIQVNCPEWATKALEPVEVTAGKTLNGQDFALATGVRIAGKFVMAESEVPVPDAKIRIQGGPGQTSSSLTWQELRTDSDGAFAIRQPAGEKPVTLWAAGGDAGFIERGDERHELELEEGKDVTDIVFTLKPWPSFKGRVLDPDGNPLAGAEVKLKQGRAKAVSNEDGTFELSPLKRRPSQHENLRLEARHPDLPDHRGLLSVQYQTVDDAQGEVQLLPTGSLKGRVIDVDGEPLASATVTLRQHFRFGNYGRLYPDGEVSCDNEGRYEFAGVASAVEHWVHAKAPGYGQDSNNEVVVSGEEMLEMADLTLLVADSFLTGAVTSEEGEPVAGVSISFNGENTGHRSAVSDKEGHFRVENLVDERIRIWAYHHQEGETLRASLSVYANEEDVEVTLGEEQANYNERADLRIVDSEAPELVVDSWVSGRPTDLASLKGKTVVLVFWDASKKKSAELPPLLSSLMREYGDSGVEFVSVHRTGEAGPIKTAVRKQGVPCRVAVDKADEESPKGATCAAYKVRGVPAVYVIDKDGRIRYQDVALPAVDEAIEAVLREDE